MMATAYHFEELVSEICSFHRIEFATVIEFYSISSGVLEIRNWKWDMGNRKWWVVVVQ